MDNKIDISNLSEIKQQILLFPDDILIKALNIAVALQSENNFNRDTFNFIPEPINLEKSVVFDTDENMAKKRKEESLLNAKTIWEDGNPSSSEIQQTSTENDTVLPPVEKMSLFNKAKSLAKAYASRGLSNNKAQESIKSLRVLSCHGNTDLPPCPHRVNSEKFKDSFYCGACGCGDRGPTQLVNILNEKGEKEYSKLDFPKVVCPLSMPGFSNYEKWKEEDQNPRKNVIESMFGIDYIMKNSNLNETEKESENDEDGNNNQTNEENS
jgi:hypothetical protein